MDVVSVTRDDDRRLDPDRFARFHMSVAEETGGGQQLSRSQPILRQGLQLLPRHDLALIGGRLHDFGHEIPHGLVCDHALGRCRPAQSRRRASA
jgi:hypothetical protein